MQCTKWNENAFSKWMNITNSIQNIISLVNYIHLHLQCTYLGTMNTEHCSPGIYSPGNSNKIAHQIPLR